MIVLTWLFFQLQVNEMTAVGMFVAGLCLVYYFAARAMEPP